jgi:hypothetical protein
MDTNELTQRLKNCCGGQCSDRRATSGCDCDAIEVAYISQAARIAELERTVVEQGRSVLRKADRELAANLRAEAAEAKVARMRDALELAAPFLDSIEGAGYGGMAAYEAAREAVRAGLRDTQP